MMVIEQREVFELVKARGYLDDWTLAQFLCRQVVKLQEELAELTETALPNTGGWRDELRATLYAGNKARHRFDLPRETSLPRWRDAAGRVSGAGRVGKVREELADLQVVLFCAAQAVSLMCGPFDVVEAALEKAEGDVGKGVR